MTNAAEVITQATEAGAEAQTATQALNAPAPAAPTPAANGEWYSGIQSEPTRTWAQAKGWKDPLAAVESAYNLEKLIGFDKAGRTIVIPNDDSTPEQRQAFNIKMGVPEKVDGYKLPVPEGMDDGFSKVAAKWFHEHGVSAKAAEGVVSAYNAYESEVRTTAEKARVVQSGQEFEEVKAEWGKAYGERIELARRGLNQFLPAESPEARAGMMDKIEAAMGTKNFLNFSYALGAGLSEHKMHDGSTPSMLTPSQASQRIAELKSNKEWTTAYLGGDKVKSKELNDLFDMVNAGGQ